MKSWESYERVSQQTFAVRLTQCISHSPKLPFLVGCGEMCPKLFLGPKRVAYKSISIKNIKNNGSHDLSLVLYSRSQSQLFPVRSDQGWQITFIWNSSRDSLLKWTWSPLVPAQNGVSRDVCPWRVRFDPRKLRTKENPTWRGKNLMVLNRFW